jgi:hypothetical protein
MAKSDGMLQGTLRNGSATFEKQTRGARGLLDHAGMRGPRAEERVAQEAMGDPKRARTGAWRVSGR